MPSDVPWADPSVPAWARDRPAPEVGAGLAEDGAPPVADGRGVDDGRTDGDVLGAGDVVGAPVPDVDFFGDVLGRAEEVPLGVDFGVPVDGAGAAGAL